MYAEQIEILVKKYLSYGKATSKEIGIHAHNNLQLAFANSIEAIIHGANRIDASMGGLGRGSGNCPMELMLGFLRNPKFKLRPVYKVLQEHLLPLSRTVEWGPQYNTTSPGSSTSIRGRHRRPAAAPIATITSVSTTSWSTTSIREERRGRGPPNCRRAARPLSATMEPIAGG